MTEGMFVLLPVAGALPSTSMLVFSFVCALGHAFKSGFWIASMHQCALLGTVDTD